MKESPKRAHPETGARAGVSPATRRQAPPIIDHALFRDLDREARGRLAATVSEQRVSAGDCVLVEQGPPGTFLYVVREGMVELVLGGTVVDIVGRGGVFGVPTLVTGRPPEFTVRARQDTTLDLVPREVAIDLLGRPPGLAMTVESLQERLARAARAVRVLSDTHRAPVSSLLRRPCVFCAPEAPIRDVARLMSEHAVTAVLVETRRGLGIVTDGDLRDRVVSAGLSADAPASDIATVPVRTIGDDRLTPETCTVEMVEAGIGHLVVVDADGRPAGIVSAGSLMVDDALNPFALRRSISTAVDEEAVVAAARRLPRVFLSLVDANFDPPSIAHVISLQSDALTRRLLELAAARLGPPPVPYAWLALGSGGRSELTLVSDQDNALAYADSPDPSVDAYFAAIGATVNDGLVRCGFSADISGVLARDDHWRMPLTRWEEVFRSCYEVWDSAHTARACVAFDFRQVAGELDAVGPLSDVLHEAPKYPSILNRLSRTVSAIRSPLGFRGRLGSHVDVKHEALLPIENIARYHALARGISAPSTLDRLTAVAGLLALEGESTVSLEDALSLDATTAARQQDREMVSALQDAFGAMMALRLRHHADAMRGGRPLDDTIETSSLGPLARVELQEALRLVSEAQKRIPPVVAT